MVEMQSNEALYTLTEMPLSTTPLPSSAPVPLLGLLDPLEFFHYSSMYI